MIDVFSLSPPERILLAAAFLACIEASAASGDSPERIASNLADQALTDGTALSIVTGLTTEIGPRLAGSESEKRAARWAKAKFEQLGFDRVWIETFPIENGWERGVEKAEVISPSPQPLVVTALGRSPATPPEGIEAEIALCKTFDELLAAPVGSLAGKIAVVTQPMVRTQDGSGYGFANRIRTAGPAEAARRGAVAYLHRSLGTDSHRVPHTGATRFSDDASRIPAAALSVPDAEQLDRLVATGRPIRVRLVLTPRDLGPVTSQNVIAEVTGREKPEEIILLGAHLDSWDLGTGAVDDGAGVAIVMAAAKLIRDLPRKPKRTIRVVLFGAEEIGIFGGQAYAEAHKDELHRHVVAAEADLGQGPIYSFRTGVSNPREPTLYAIRAALTPLKIVMGDNEFRGNSDIAPMARLGVPVVGLMMDASDYFDLHHTPDDTLDKIQPAQMNQSTAAYATFAYLAAELDGNYRALTPARQE